MKNREIRANIAQLGAEAQDLSGALWLPGFLDDDQQREILSDLRSIIAAAPMFQPVTRRGTAMSVRMTSAGRYGWYSDRRGYRYIRRHPDGSDWPDIPQNIMAIWDAVTGLARRPECCLVNYYDSDAKMGLHQDRDEASFDWPVLSISLGDAARFRIGGAERGGRTESVWLRSGDVVVLTGPSRLAYHGIDRIRAGSSRLLEEGGRLNLTLRVVD